MLQICGQIGASISKLERGSAFILVLMRVASLSHHQASISSTFWRQLMNDRIRVMQRQPRRISITLSYHVHEALLTRSEEEGRSVSNLCAFLLEDALRDPSRSVAATQPQIAHTGNGFNANAARLKARPY
jgi:hypothetical protein